jgi:hypothetical protein
MIFHLPGSPDDEAQMRVECNNMESGGKLVRVAMDNDTSWQVPADVPPDLAELTTLTVCATATTDDWWDWRIDLSADDVRKIVSTIFHTNRPELVRAVLEAIPRHE